MEIVMRFFRWLTELPRFVKPREPDKAATAHHLSSVCMADDCRNQRHVEEIQEVRDKLRRIQDEMSLRERKP